MRQFEVFENPDPSSRNERPFFIVLQHSLHDGLSTVVVAPLYREHVIRLMSALTPKVIVEREAVRIAIPELSFVPRAFLQGRPLDSDSAERRYDIVGALDLLFTGI